VPEIKIDYDVLNKAKRDLEALAGEIGPLVTNGIFGRLGRANTRGGVRGVPRNSEAESIFGNHAVAGAVASFHSNAGNTMKRADKGLKELAAAFGSVGEAFRQFDTELAAQVGVMSANLHVQNWRQQKAQWDYKQSHLGDCKGPGKLPDFCSATDPGNAPPDFQVNTPNGGSIKSHVDVDDQGHVIKEETSVTYDGQTYTSTTTYNGPSYTTDTTYPDGSTTHTVASVNDDGSGTMTVTGSDGSHTEYTRGPKGADGKAPEWQLSGGDKPDNPNAHSTPDPNTHPQSPGTKNGTSIKIA
jgi:hypothetical protein